MQLPFSELYAALKSGLAPLYLIHGDEPLLALEAIDHIRTHARQRGFQERFSFTVENHFNWMDVVSNGSNLSLFSTKKLIELTIPSGKPGIIGAQALEQISTYCGEELLLAVMLPKLDKATLNSKWFSALAQKGVIIAIAAVTRRELPQWLNIRLQIQQQQLDQPTLEFLADQVEGNLLAARQEVDKLGLLFPSGKLSFEQVKYAVCNAARYDVFQLSEAILTGDIVRYSRILEGLQAEGVATTLVLWQLAEEVRTLIAVRNGLRAGVPTAQLLREQRVWGARQQWLPPAAKRIKLKALYQGLNQAAEIDRLIKGLKTGLVWDELLQLGLGLMQHNIGQ